MSNNNAWRSTEATVRRFWSLMASNDFRSVAQVLHADFVLDWPQSGERIHGAEHFAQMNAAYPAHGSWRFTLRNLVVADDAAVTEVEVSDGVQQGRAISFFSLRDGLIVGLREFWPEPFAPAPWRSAWVERVDADRG